jgi:hypothetical protein
MWFRVALQARPARLMLVQAPHVPLMLHKRWRERSIMRLNLVVPNLDPSKMISKRLDQTLGQSSHAVLLALAVAVTCLPIFGPFDS